LAVEHGKAGGTERLLGHLPDEGDDYGGSLFALAVVEAGEPSWCFTHFKRRVGGFDFGSNIFGGGGGQHAV